MRHVAFLDCTLRDGAYIVNSMFGKSAMIGIIGKMQAAGADLIECGWLKDSPHKEGSSFFHVPSDLKPYISRKEPGTLNVAMIDWDRYDVEQLPENDGSSIDAIRVVFPHGKFKEGVAVGEKIREKGYTVMYQAANTLSYSDDDIIALAGEINRARPMALSIVDTFGAMRGRDLKRIASLLDRCLSPEIRLGFHSHNNRQMSFALSMQFVEMFRESSRDVIVDASLCGMGRGAGNAATELVMNYLNEEADGNYDMDAVMDAIDMYMQYFQENYTWGYSTPYFIAGVYGCHVNNIAYLLRNHRTNARDMRNIIRSMSAAERTQYDYDLLEQKYLENQSHKVEDKAAADFLRKSLKNKKVLLIAPGKSTITHKNEIYDFIEKQKPVIMGVNAVNALYRMDYLFFANATRFHFAKEVYPELFSAPKKLLLSNIKTVGNEDELIFNFDSVVQRGWLYFDNAVITCLRLLSKLHVQDVAISGFDGFKTKYNESYADASLPTLNPDNNWAQLNDEIRDMFLSFKRSVGDGMKIEFVTESIFDEKGI